MIARQRVDGDAAWLLHHRPFRDSSQILDLLTREHGRVAVVARGSRGARSRLKGILRAFLPLRASWVSRSDLGTLTGAEIDGRPVALTGEALLSGYYVNELLLRLMPRHDPQADIFDAYAATVRALAGCHDPAPVLREFELTLLRLLGYALDLGGGLLVAEERYEYRVEQGPVPVGERQGAMVFTGRQLAAIERREFDHPEVLRGAGRLLRGVITYHLDGRELMSRKVLRDIRRRGRDGGDS